MNIINIGNFDPCGNLMTLTNAINNYTSHSVRSIILSRYVDRHSTDICIDDFKGDFEEVRELIKEADVLFFHLTDWNTTPSFGPIRWRDYVVGKKVTVCLYGESFHHNRNYYLKKYSNLGIKIFASAPLEEKLIPNSEFIPWLFPINDPLWRPKEERSEPELIKICHSPGGDIRKNTCLFENVMGKIIKRYKNVRQVLITGKSHAESLSIRRDCDISFDTIYFYGYWGVSTHEALSMGLPSLAWGDEVEVEGWKKAYGCFELPVVIVNPNNLYDKFKELVENPDKRREIGRKSRGWTEKYADDRELIKRHISFYESLPVLRSLN